MTTQMIQYRNEKLHLSNYLFYNILIYKTFDMVELRFQLFDF